MPVKQNVSMRLVVSAIAIVCLIGCSSSRQATGPNPQATALLDPWVITNLDTKIDTPALLWNGLIGVRINPLGRESNSFAIDKYESGGEEKIQPQGTLLGFHVSAGGSDLSTGFASAVKRTLNLKTGEVTVELERDRFRDVFTEVQTVIDPVLPIVAEKWTIHPAKTYSFQIQSSGGSKLVTSETLPNGDVHIAFQPVTRNREGYIPRTWVGTVNAGSKLIIEHVADLRLINQGAAQKPLVVPGQVKSKDEELTTRYGDVLKRSQEYWANAWQTDIEVDGPVEDQQFIRSALFYLRSAIHPEGKMSISPMGLSSDIYNGHVFWDADIWVFPALALIDPDRAKAIPAYRLKHVDQAQRNFYDWVIGGKQVGSGTSLGKPITGLELDRFDPISAAKFPWESSVSGKETVPGPSKFQDHISGSIAWSVSSAASLGLVDATTSQSLLTKVAGFFRARSTDGESGLREIRGTMSPDEHHTGDNDLYTNLLAMWCENNGNWPDQPIYKLPGNDKSFLTYDNDPVRGYKQAAAVLSIYPLQYPPAEKQARQMMDRFADKVTKNGPAMTDSIHSIIWSRLGEKDKAYKTWHDSWKPFVKPPFLLFSEKRNSSRTYFTTGAAGSLQAVLYGFAGIRIDSKKAPNAQWSIPLKNGQILSIAPNLPKEWKKLTLRNLTILGKKYTFEIAGDKVKVTEGG